MRKMNDRNGPTEHRGPKRDCLIFSSSIQLCKAIIGTFSGMSSHKYTPNGEICGKEWFKNIKMVVMRSHRMTWISGAKRLRIGRKNNKYGRFYTPIVALGKKIGFLIAIVNFTPFYPVCWPISLFRLYHAAPQIPGISQMRPSKGCAIAVIALLLAGRADADQIQWHTTIEEGRQLAAQAGKLVLVHFWSTSCPPCVRLEQQVYSRAEVADKIGVSFVPVKINATDNTPLLRQYQIRFLPTDLVMAPDGRVLAVQRCPLDATQYLAGLSRFASPQANGTREAVVSAESTFSRSQSLNNLPRTEAPPLGPRYTEISQGYKPNYSQAGYESAMPVTAAKAFGHSPPTPAVGPTPRTIVNPTVVSSPERQAPGRSDLRNPNLPNPDPLPPRYQRPPDTSQTVFEPSPPTASSQPALDSMCTVELVENERWVPGNRRWGAFHRGRLYLFAGENQQQRFMSNPDFYSPILSGNDPVLALEDYQTVPGKRQHGVYYNQRVYLFSSEETLARFYRNPNRYAEVVLRAEATTSQP